MRTFYFKARTIGQEKYLTYTMGEDCELDEDVLDFIEENNPVELVNIIYEEDDDYDYLTYDITERVSLEALIRQDLDAESVLFLLKNIASSLISLKEQTIPLNYILLNRNFVYADENLSVYFMCVPVESKGSVAVEFKGFVRELLANMVYDVDEDLNYVGRLLTYINGENFNLRGLIGLVEALMEEEGIEFDEEGGIESEGVEVISTEPEVMVEEKKESKVADFMSSMGDADGPLPEIGDDEEDEEEETLEDDSEELESIVPKGLKVDEPEENPVAGAASEKSESIAEEKLQEVKQSGEDATPMDEKPAEKPHEKEVVAEKKLQAESTKPQETAKPEEQEVKPEETVKPQAEEVKPEETVKPQAEEVKPEETVKPQTAETEQGAESQKTEPVAKENEPIEKPAEPVAKTEQPQADLQDVKLQKPRNNQKETDVDIIKNRVKAIVDADDEDVQSAEDLDTMFNRPPSVKKNVVKVNRAALIQQQSASEHEEDEGVPMVPVEGLSDEGDAGKPKSSSVLSKKVDTPQQTTTVSIIKINPYLIRVNTEEKIMITKTVFKLGKSARGVDYTVSGNGAISRQHATIIQKDGVCYIKDNKSTNHTYVNDRMVEDGVEEILTHDSTIRLGDEEFKFKIR